MPNHQIYDKHKRNQDAKRFYNSTAWVKCRELALIRDHYLCQECLRNKTITIAEMVHHIKPREDHPELSLTLSNLESLCNSCHNKEHPEKGGGEKKEKVSSAIKIIESGANENIV